MRCYPHFILPMRSSRGFASTAPNQWGALFGLAFAWAPPQNGLTGAGDGKSPDHYAKGTPSPGPHCWGIGLRPLVGVWFQVHYPPLEGVLPIVRSRYWCAIGRQGVLSLAGWAPRVQAHFHVLGLTQVPARPPSPAAYGTITRCGRPFQTGSARVLGT